MRWFRSLEKGSGGRGAVDPACGDEPDRSNLSIVPSIGQPGWGVLYLIPGAAGSRRYTLLATVGRLYIDTSGCVSGEIIELTGAA